MMHRRVLARSGWLMVGLLITGLALAQEVVPKRHPGGMLMGDLNGRRVYFPPRKGFIVREGTGSATRVTLEMTFLNPVRVPVTAVYTPPPVAVLQVEDLVLKARQRVWAGLVPGETAITVPPSDTIQITFLYQAPEAMPAGKVERIEVLASGELVLLDEITTRTRPYKDPLQVLAELKAQYWRHQDITEETLTQRVTPYYKFYVDGIDMSSQVALRPTGFGGPYGRPGAMPPMIAIERVEHRGVWSMHLAHYFLTTRDPTPADFRGPVRGPVIRTPTVGKMRRETFYASFGDLARLVALGEQTGAERPTLEPVRWRQDEAGRFLDLSGDYDGVTHALRTWYLAELVAAGLEEMRPAAQRSVDYLEYLWVEGGDVVPDYAALATGALAFAVAREVGLAFRSDLLLRASWISRYFRRDGRGAWYADSNLAPLVEALGTDAPPTNRRRRFWESTIRGYRWAAPRTERDALRQALRLMAARKVNGILWGQIRPELLAALDRRGDAHAGLLRSLAVADLAAFRVPLPWRAR